MPDEIPGDELKGSAEAAVDSSDALDALLAQAGGESDENSNTSAEEKAVLDKQNADEAAKNKADEDAKAKADADAKAKADADAASGDADAKAKADAAAAAKTDELDSIELPPHVKPKTVESFTRVKEMARTKIAELNGSVEKLTADLKAANEAIELGKAGKASKEVEAELEELRAFRRSVDVEADPEFNKFNEQIAANDESIYSRLKKAGFDDDSIKRVKQLGGPSQVDWGKLGDKVPADVKRFIDVKLVENESLSDSKENAIAKAKKNSVEFLKTRQQESTKSEGARKEIANKQFSDLAAKNLTWLAEQAITKDTKPADKVKIEAHNAKVKEILTDVKDALNDHSPEMHAVLVTGYANMLKGRADLAEEKAARKVEVDKLNATIKEKEKFIADMSKASTGRLGGGGAPTGGATKTVKAANIDESSDSALDRLRGEVETAAANRE